MLNVKITMGSESWIPIPLVTLPTQQEQKNVSIARKSSIFSNIPKNNLPVTIKSDEPDMYEDEIDVSKIDIAEFMVEEAKNTKRDRKNAKVRTQHGHLEPMKQYMDDVAKIPLITKELEAVLAEQIHSGDRKLHDEACQTLIKSNLRLVVKIAHDFLGFGLPILDLISEGNIGLTKAVEKFDPKLGAKFSSYAAWWIKQSMHRAITNQGGTIRIPVQSLSKMGRIRSTIDVLKDRLGRIPTNEEIAKETGLTVRSIAALRLCDHKTISINAPIKDGEDGNFGDLISDNSVQRPDEILGKRETYERLITLVNQLDERERTIIVARFGLDGKPPRTLDKISKEIGRTRERIRQIQTEALDKLKNLLEEKVEITG